MQNGIPHYSRQFLEANYHINCGIPFCILVPYQVFIHTRHISNTDHDLSFASVVDCVEVIDSE